MNITDATLTVCNPSGRYSYVYGFLNEEGRCIYGKKTLEELKAFGEVGPDAFVVPWGEAWPLEKAWQRERYCTGPARITAEAFDDALNCLPPQGWVNTGSHESFKMSEMLTGDLTACYVRLGQSHWVLNESVFTSHDELIEQVIEAAALQGVA